MLRTNIVMASLTVALISNEENWVVVFQVLSVGKWRAFNNAKIVTFVTFSLEELFHFSISFSYFQHTRKNCWWSFPFKIQMATHETMKAFKSTYKKNTRFCGGNAKVVCYFATCANLCHFCLERFSRAKIENVSPSLEFSCDIHFGYVLLEYFNRFECSWMWVGLLRWHCNLLWRMRRVLHLIVYFCSH